MERRLFMQALAASVVAAGAPLPMGFPAHARGLEIVWHGPGAGGTIDPFNELATCGWKAVVNGAKYGDWVVVDPDASKKDRADIEEWVRSMGEGSIRRLLA